MGARRVEVSPAAGFADDVVTLRSDNAEGAGARCWGSYFFTAARYAFRSCLFTYFKSQPLGLLVCLPIRGIGATVITGCFVCVTFSHQRICLGGICAANIGDGLHDDAAD